LIWFIVKGLIEMPRDIVVSNGLLSIALDKKMAIRDFFYPHVGLENHVSGHKFRLGVEAERFSWIEDDWKVSMKYLPETLVSMCSATNSEIGIELEINDAVYSFLDLYLRKVSVKNLADKKREVKVFFSHDFHIYGEDAGDTVMFEPDLQSIIHYKRKRYFLINGITDQNNGIHEFATGQKEAFGREGTWKDAEDGKLEGNPIAQGSVDSTVSFKLEMNPKTTNLIYYWIACGKNMEKVRELNSIAKKTGGEQMLLETENYWSAWVNKQNQNLTILPQEVIRMFKTSLLIMRTHVDNQGGILASCDSDVLQFNRDTYSYVWPRDAAICAIAFDMAGFQEVSRLFFDFCNRVISDEGYFMHKYWSDGSVGSSWHALVDSDKQPQLPIQLDETAIVLYALWKHFQRYRDLEFISRMYPKLVIKAAQFMQKYRDLRTGLPKPSFDLWEEKSGIFTSTAAIVCAALFSAAEFAKVFYDSRSHETLKNVAVQMKEGILTHLYDAKLKRFIRAIFEDGRRDTIVDSSLSFTFLFGTIDANSKEVAETVNSITERLWVNPGIGGLARYENDKYHRVNRDTSGNPWFICTLWLARWYIRIANTREDLKKPMELLLWTIKNSMPPGVLAEQLNPNNSNPISVAPLTWSHAEFVITVCEYVDKHQQLSSI
jgi:GH15 family glucan-1,4-alpha-glucosidase